jgi:membrane protein DedA with SNARE-associated domain
VDKILDGLIDFLLGFYWVGAPYLLIFGVLISCGLGVPIPEDIILFTAGYSAYYGIVSLPVIIGLAVIGVLMGDVLIFALGAKYGRKLTKKWIFHQLLPDDRLNKVKKLFHERGNKLLFAARFMPGFRAPVYFSAGTLHIPFWRFLIYDGLAALISVPAIIGAVYYFGDQIDQVIRWIKRIENGIVFVILAIVLAILAKWYITHRKLKRG